jgi:glycosyltransferase involved in cell wall biosynthesis
MKILWVNPSFLDYRIPVYACLNELTGGNFYLVYSKQRVPKRCIEKIENALGHNALGLENEKSIQFGAKRDFANTGISIPYPKGLYKLLSTVKPDIIISEGYFQWTPWALLRARRLKIPLIIAYERTAHTERDCPWWRKLYRKILNKYIDGFVINGSLTQQYLKSLGVSSAIIQTGVMSADSNGLSETIKCMSESEKIASSKELNLNKGLTYLYIGQLIERKGVAYLLDAWKKHILNRPNDNLLIVGNGPLYKNFKEKYGNIVSIHFTGNVDYDLIYRYYAISDVFIIPTLEDNWSLVVPEAMACGLPIACSIYNGCFPELVSEGENGILFDALKEDTILKALEFFHYADLYKMGVKSIEIENNYTPDKAANRIYEACITVIARQIKKQNHQC